MKKNLQKQNTGAGGLGLRSRCKARDAINHAKSQGENSRQRE